MVLGLTPSSSGNAIEFEFKVVGAPIDITVCSTFTVDIAITPLAEHPMDGFQIRVLVDLGFMKIVDAENHIEENGWDENDIQKEALASTGESYTLRINNQPYYREEASWVTLTIHCEGAGASTIDLDETYCEIFPSNFHVIRVADATVNQSPRPKPPYMSGWVGGELHGVNKLAVAAPFLALIGLVVAIATVYVATRRRKA